MLEIMLNLVFGFILGLGVGAWLALKDTRLGIHGPSLPGPKFQKRLKLWYQLLALAGIIGWMGTASLSSHSSRWYIPIGLAGAVAGVICSNR